MKRLEEDMAVYNEWVGRLSIMPAGDARAKVQDVLDAVRDNLIRAANLVEIKKEFKAERFLERAETLFNKLNQ